MCLRAVKALTRWRICAGLAESSLLACIRDKYHHFMNWLNSLFIRLQNGLKIIAARKKKQLYENFMMKQSVAKVGRS